MFKIVNNLSRGRFSGTVFQRFISTELIKVGDKASLAKTFTSADVEAFAELTCDTNPIHLDDAVAKESRFGGRVVHGVLTFGLLSGVMGTQLPGTGTIVLSYDVTHPFPLYVDEPVVATATVREIQGRLVTLDLLCTGREDKVVTKGEAKLLAPKNKVRRFEPGSRSMTSEGEPGRLFGDSWSRLTAAVDAHVADKWRRLITDRYGETQRHYHTLTHVEELLALLHQHDGTVTDVDAVTHAIIFHDVIYDPKAGDNEEQSAELFKQFAVEASCDSALTEKVVRYILATKSHVLPSDDPGSDAEDLALFLDFDMAVLGRPLTGYKEYSQQIRQEYIHFPEAVFNSRRAKVLQSMLDVPHIYASAIFREQLEQQARDNMAREIQLLNPTRL